jgi:hypothetical protein
MGKTPALLTGITPEQYKLELRRAHLLEHPRCYAEAVEQAMRFFEKYERVNRDFLPDDPVYSVTRSASITIGNDILTFSAVASRQWRLLELIAGSEGTSSAAHRDVWQRSTSGATGGGGVTPEKFNTNSPASMFTSSNLFTTWTTQPTLAGAAILSFGNNNLGGYYDWKAAPGAEINHVNEQVSYRAVAGTAAAWSYTVIYEDL